MTEIDNAEIDAVVTEAREGFDLGARLKGRKLRDGAITLFLDEEAGEALGDASEGTNAYGVKYQTREGVLGALADATSEDDIARLEAERDELIAALEATALVVKFRAVPAIVVKDSRRKAKETLKIKGSVPEYLEEDFSVVFVDHVLAASITSIEDRVSGGVNGKQTYEQIKQLGEYLPRDEFQRLVAKQSEVQTKNTIGESVTGSADF